MNSNMTLSYFSFKYKTCIDCEKRLPSRHQTQNNTGRCRVCHARFIGKNRCQVNKKWFTWWTSDFVTEWFRENVHSDVSIR